MKQSLDMSKTLNADLAPGFSGCGCAAIQSMLQFVKTSSCSVTHCLQAMSMGPEIAPSVGVGPLGPTSGNQGFAMGLAVPGLTVPWGHAGYLWLATAASIAVHEVRAVIHLQFMECRRSQNAFRKSTKRQRCQSCCAGLKPTSCLADSQQVMLRHNQLTICLDSESGIALTWICFSNTC